MTPELIETLGDELYSALCARTVVEPLTSRHPDITIEHAYHIQQRMISRRLQAGERVVGKKIGVTSAAVMNMLGVYQPDFGYMLDGMIVSDGGSIAMSSLIQPKAEGEIAFVLKKDLMGPGVTNADVVGEIGEWLSYDLPPQLQGVAMKGRYRGQRQRWFAMRLTGPDSEIDIRPKDKKPEFDAWRWVGLGELTSLIVPFKRDVYAQVVAAFTDLAG